MLDNNDKNDENIIDQKRRKFLKIGVQILGGISVAAAAYPFIKALEPSEEQKHEMDPVTIDISNLHPGELWTISWQNKPVWIIRRTLEELAILNEPNPQLLDPNSLTDQQPAFARNPYRSLTKEILVLVGLCTHLGCIPNFLAPANTPNKEGGFLCPCHGSRYDLAGRVYKNMPAPLNLLVPPYYFLDKNTLVVGKNL